MSSIFSRQKSGVAVCRKNRLVAVFPLGYLPVKIPCSNHAQLAEGINPRLAGFYAILPHLNQKSGGAFGAASGKLHRGREKETTKQHRLRLDTKQKRQEKLLEKTKKRAEKTKKRIAMLRKDLETSRTKKLPKPWLTNQSAALGAGRAGHTFLQDSHDQDVVMAFCIFDGGVTLRFISVYSL